MASNRTSAKRFVPDGPGKSADSGFRKACWVLGIFTMMLVFLSTGCTKKQIVHLNTFSTSHLSAGYHFVNDATYDESGNPDKYFLNVGHLHIKAGKRQDMWGGSGRAPLMLRPVPKGDYRVETFVNAHPQPINTQAGIFVFEDMNNWFFFGLTNHSFTLADGLHQGNGLMLTKTEGGNSTPMPIPGASDTDYPTHILKMDLVHLRIDKKGDSWKCYWKLHADDAWNHLTTMSFALGDHEVGMGVKTLSIAPGGVENECTAKFDYLSIWQNWSITTN